VFFTAVRFKFTLWAAMTTSPVTAPNTTGRVLHRAAGYDLLVWLLTRGRSRAFRNKLVALAHLAPGESVLDVGCGTGSLAIAAKRQVGAAGEVIGIDASPAMIARATTKAARAGAAVRFDTAIVEALPFPDARFDVVLSTLMFHHLPRPVRQQCAREIRRLLKPGGRLLLVDFGQPQDRHSFLAHVHRHGHVNLQDVVSQLDEAGLRCTDSGPIGISSLHYLLAVVAE
jgi:ubiquinone/menaquinone biosynthesis C-methylase UbiE